MRIGVPRETLPGETRVAIAPDTVKTLLKQGFSVVIEAGAGALASFPDERYEAAGATMADVVWTTVFTTDMREFREIVAAREEFWRDNLPTSTMIEISHLTEPAAKIEVQVIAAVA